MFGSRRLDIESSRDRFLHTGGLPEEGRLRKRRRKGKKKKERHGRCSRGVERGVAERKWKPASLLDPLQRFYLPFRQCQPRGFIKQFLVAAAGEKSAWKIDSFRHGGCLRTRFLREPPFPPAAPPQDHLYYRYRDGRESPENVIKSVSTAFYRAHTAGSCCAIVLAPQTNVWMPPARTKIQISKLCEAMGGRPLGRFHRICKKFKRIESIFLCLQKIAREFLHSRLYSRANLEKLFNFSSLEI